MDKSSISGEALAEIGQSQVSTNKTSSDASGDQGAVAMEQGAAQTQSNQDLVNAMYGGSDQGQEGKAQSQQVNPQQLQAADQKKIDEIRNKLNKQLHDEVYYGPLLAYEHKKPETLQDRQQKEEEEKQMKKMEDIKKEEKQQPIAVSRAQTGAERQRGASG